MSADGESKAHDRLWSAVTHQCTATGHSLKPPIFDSEFHSPLSSKSARNALQHMLSRVVGRDWRKKETAEFWQGSRWSYSAFAFLFR